LLFVKKSFTSSSVRGAPNPGLALRILIVIHSITNRGIFL
jgi:hypothetical protein